jgi:hypothetical protein
MEFDDDENKSKVNRGKRSRLEPRRPMAGNGSPGEVDLEDVQHLHGARATCANGVAMTTKSPKKRIFCHSFHWYYSTNLKTIRKQEGRKGGEKRKQVVFAVFLGWSLSQSLG